MRLQNGFGDVVGAELIGAHRRPPCPSPSGRVCAHPSCTTILSIYNEDTCCARHSFLHVDAGAVHNPRPAVARRISTAA